MIPKIDCSLGEARAYSDGENLIVTTGKVTREWKWSGKGFATESFKEIGSDSSWETTESICDWQLPDATDPSSAELIKISAKIADDEGFTSKHIAVSSEIDYPDSGFTILWSIWVYPNAPGIRTQLSARTSRTSEKGVTVQGGPVDGRVDCIPIGNKTTSRRFIGYYNETQQRNDTHHDIIKEELISHPLMEREWCTWASIACVEGESGGIALVKESHKCVNQKGHITGGFICDEKQGVVNTGWGMKENEVSDSEFTPGWASWSIAWSGGCLEREIALKTFDKIRYPIDPERDIYIQANTWGSTINSQDARRAACEQSVLEELESCKELGIEVLQIDDGWQVVPGHHTWNPGERGWHPHPEGYPDGWEKVKTRAAELGIKLGLWAAAMPVSLDELKSNFSKGGFVQFKLDFASLKTHKEINDLMEKVREFIKFTGHQIRVNWDVTENPARYGYFFAREYGCIYLENRKPERPLSVIYKPHTVLRDIWQISKYLNIHRFQCSVQNVDMVNREFSDAYLHPHDYSTAIALVGIPLFFQQTKYYSKAAKIEIRELLEEYKQHREAMFNSIVHPIGSKPDNASWTGFQFHTFGEDRGYLLVFRERCNTDEKHSFKLGWVNPGNIKLTDLITSETTEKTISENGSIELKIDSAPGFKFLEYSFTE